MIVPVAVVLMVSCALGCGLTWILRAVAPRAGLLDPPDQFRKLHRAPTPLGGGVAILVASVTVLAVLWYVPNPLRAPLQAESLPLKSLLLAATVIVLVGVLDDRITLRGRQKLVGQAIAASILMIGGLSIERIVIFDYPIQLGLLAIPFTLCWLLGAINAINLLDGIDGLASVLGIILTATIGLMAAVTGHPSVATIALVFSGTLLGFLRFNFPPASIFLGDAGSMLIGLTVGALAIHGTLKGVGTVLLAAPLAVWTLPIFDSAVAILRRRLTGRSIYTTDRAHLHHQLLDRFGSNRKVLALIAVSCLLTSVAALVSVFVKSDSIALLAAAAVVIMFIATGMFGRTEFFLLASRVRTVVWSLMKPVETPSSRNQQSVVRLQGSRRWDVLWDLLTGCAEKYGLNEVHFNVDIPKAREGYHADWKRPAQGPPERQWAVELPLFANQHAVGRIRVAGVQNGRGACEVIEEILEVLDGFVVQVGSLAEQAPLGLLDVRVGVAAVPSPAEASGSTWQDPTPEASAPWSPEKPR